MRYLRLSEMMRYVLYDCRDNRVELEKDIHFLSNYLEMERRRYPQADIVFAIDGPFDGMVAPLLLIPFVENSFKHGAHRVVDDAVIRGAVRAGDGQLEFSLENSVLPLTQAGEGLLMPAGKTTLAPSGKTPYGGVGIENVRKRLALYYPGKFDLRIHSADNIYSVNLKIQLR